VLYPFFIFNHDFPFYGLIPNLKRQYGFDRFLKFYGTEYKKRNELRNYEPVFCL